MESSFAEMLREEVGRSEAVDTVELQQEPLSLPTLEDRVADPARWIVNLDEEFRELARSMVDGRAGADSPTVLAGATGSGKTLLLGLADHLAEDVDDLTGERYSAGDLLDYVDDDADEVQVIEELIGVWQERRDEGDLDYLLIDDTKWFHLSRGRLRQLGRALRSSPPALIFAMDFLDYHELVGHDGSIRKKWNLVTIPPYQNRELEDLWNRHADNRWLDETSLNNVLEHSIGNPDLLLTQFEEVARASNRKGGMGSKFLKTMWDRDGYDTALKIRQDGIEVKDTKRRILAAICRQQGATATELSGSLDLERSLCSYHLSDLSKQGLLKRQQEGPKAVYYAPKPVERAVEMFVVMGYE